MNTRVLALAFGLTAVVCVEAQTNYYQQISAMWFAGNKQGVLDIANQRLAQNTNDIAGLLLRLEYEIEFLQLNNMTNSMARVLDAGSSYAGTNFAQVYATLEASYDVMKQVVTNYPPDEYAADLAKTNAVGKTMSCDAELKALQEDGYFQ